MRLINLVALVLLAFTAISCDISTPVQGLQKGKIDKRQNVVLVMTYVKLGDDLDSNKQFWRQTNEIRSYIKKDAKGVLGYKYSRNIFTGEVYSYIIFDNYKSVEIFGSSKIHRQAKKYSNRAVIDANIKIITVNKSKYNVKWHRIKKILSKEREKAIRKA